MSGGRKCRGPISERGADPSGFPQPQVRRSRHGVLQTTIHACISTNEMLDQNTQPPTTVEFHPPTFEGTISGPTLKVKPGDRLSILLVNICHPTRRMSGITPFRMREHP